MDKLLGAIFASIVGVVLGATLQQHIANDRLLRDCELTRVHVVDDNTVLVCSVVKRRPEQPKVETETEAEDYL